jgi:hypothetical protein
VADFQRADDAGNPAIGKSRMIEHISDVWPAVMPPDLWRLR